jgi:peptidylprolyl isomerase
MTKKLMQLLAVIGACCAALGAEAKTMTEVLAASKPADWRALDPQRTLYLELASGRVVIELAPQFAPRHVENIQTLVRELYFDGLAINRSQDNFVVQWGDPDGVKPLGKARKTLAAEFTRPAAGLEFIALPDPDTYAPQTGFVDGFPAARDPATGVAWLVHCYGMIGAGRDNNADSGGGTELYVVTGHAPRQLDRNITLIGRVLQGMELLSSLPRGPAPMGFYEKPEQRTSIRQLRLAAEVPEAERTTLEVLRTDTQTFADLIESRRNRRDEWYKVPAGRIDVCNVPLPVRKASASPPER